MRINLDYRHVQKLTNAYGKMYYFFFRRGMAKPMRLPGTPNTREFDKTYRALLRQHDPKYYHAAHQRPDREPGTLAWVIEQFTAPNALPWSQLSAATREKYRLRFDWLRAHYGDMLLASFERNMVKVIRKPVIARRNILEVLASIHSVAG